MIRFSASEAAMTGFGIVAKRPVLLIWWTLLHIVYIGVTTAMTVTIAGPALTQIMALQAQHIPADPQVQAQNMALFRQLAPLYLLMAPVMLVFYAVLYAAMNRAVLRPTERAFGYLRLGADEWRQFLLFLWVIVVGVGVYILLLLTGIVVALAGAFAFAKFYKGAAGDGADATNWATIAIFLLCVLVWIYVLVRLSLASAMTFDTRKVKLLASWRLTKGRFWPMLGAYVLALIFSLIVGLLGLVVMIVCTMLVGGGTGLAFIFRPDMSSPVAYFTPVRLMYLFLAGVLYALVWPVMFTPSAAIYKALTAKPEPTPASWPSPSAPPPDPFCALPDAPAPP